MNYKTVKNQLYNIVVTEVAKYYQKSLSPAGLPLEDLKALELLSKICNFEENIKAPEIEAPQSKEEVEDLLKLVKRPKNDSKPGRSEE
jgi:hypothetical protein